MAFISKQQVKDIIQNAPPGSTPQGIIAGLRSRGHQLEGFDEVAKGTQKSGKTTLEHVAGFLDNIFGGRVIGEAIGTKAAQLGLTGLTSEQRKVVSPVPTTRQITGDILRTGTTIAAAALPVASTIGGTAAQFGALGAGIGAGESLVKGESFENAAKNALTQGFTGAVVGGTLGVIGKGISYLTEKAPERIYNSALRVNQKIIQAGKSPSRQLIEEGHFGTLGSLSKQVNEGMSALHNQIKNKLSQSAEEIVTQDIINTSFNKLKTSFGRSFSEDTLREFIQKSPIADLLQKDKLDLVSANELRQQLQKQLKTAFYLRSEQMPIQKEVLGIIEKTLRNKIQTLSGTSKEFSKLSNYIQADKLIQKTVATAEKNFKISLRDVLAAGTGELLGGLPGAVGGVALEQLGKSPLALTGISVGLDRIGKAIEKLPTDAMGRISKISLIKILNEISSSSGQDQAVSPQSK